MTVRFLSIMEELKARNMNTTVLAYLGDAVYEEFVRRRLVLRTVVSGSRVDMIHKEGVSYVNAYAQAKALAALREKLTADEDALVLRARNHKAATKAKNADIRTYKWATAFEALLGYLSLSGQEERLQEIMEAAAAVIEGDRA